MTKNVLFLGKGNTKDLDRNEVKKILGFSSSDDIELSQFSKGFKSTDPFCKLLMKADATIIESAIDPYILADAVMIAEEKPVIILSGKKNVFKKVFLVQEE